MEQNKIFMENPGKFEIRIGASSQDNKLKKSIVVTK